MKNRFFARGTVLCLSILLLTFPICAGAATTKVSYPKDYTVPRTKLVVTHFDLSAEKQKELRLIIRDVIAAGCRGTSCDLRRRNFKTKEEVEALAKNAGIKVLGVAIIYELNTH